MAGSSYSRWVVGIPRVLFGLLFLASGIAGFFVHPPASGMPAFAKAMMDTGYLFQLLKGTEVTVGLLILINRFVPLALVVIAPVIVNIFCFHLFLERKELPMAAAIVAVYLFLVFSYRKAYRPLFTAKTTL